MRIISICLFVFLFIGLNPIFSQSTKNGNLDFKFLEKSFVAVKENLYAGKYEVSNLFYRQFTYYLKVSNKVELLKIAQPDTLNWLDKKMYNEPFVNLYFRHPAYSNFPVVNISYEAAVLFCNWLSDEYNANPKKQFKKVKFRLPTSEEWEYAASCGKSSSLYPWGYSLISNGKYMCSFRHIGDESIILDSISQKPTICESCCSSVAGYLNDIGDLTSPVDSYVQNDFGLFNVCGNVAEMVQEKGISRGGSWKSFGGDVTLKSKGKYSKSDTDLGFRYFMEIIEK